MGRVGERVGWVVGEVLGALGRGVGAVGEVDGLAVGPAVGALVGALVDAGLGATVGSAVGAAVGAKLGTGEGLALGAADGNEDGSAVGTIVGDDEGNAVGILVGDAVGDSVPLAAWAISPTMMSIKVNAQTINTRRQYSSLSPSCLRKVCMQKVSQEFLSCVSSDPSSLARFSSGSTPSSMSVISSFHVGSRFSSSFAGGGASPRDRRRFLRRAFLVCKDSSTGNSDASCRAFSHFLPPICSVRLIRIIFMLLESSRSKIPNNSTIRSSSSFASQNSANSLKVKDRCMLLRCSILFFFRFVPFRFEPFREERARAGSASSTFGPAAVLTRSCASRTRSCSSVASDAYSNLRTAERLACSASTCWKASCVSDSSAHFVLATMVAVRLQRSSRSAISPNDRFTPSVSTTVTSLSTSTSPSATMNSLWPTSPSVQIGCPGS